MLALLYIVVLVLAFPVGYLLAWLAKDELFSWRKYYITMAVISIILTLPVYLFNLFSTINLPIILTLFFIAIISLMALWKSYDKKFLLEKETL